MNKKAIIALGGNALIKKGQKGTIYEQFANTRKLSKSIVKIINDGYNIVLTHGNGPQVGAILLQNNKTRDILPPMPLGVCVAESQGLIGYMIQQTLLNSLKKNNIKKDVVSVLTQVIVDEDDSSFKNPTKPIGPYYDENKVDSLEEDGYTVKKIKDGYRIVVPSPDPKSIVERDVIKKLLDEGVLVIAAGGGGMPVVSKKDWGLDGVEAVVDKDLASERLAEEINADTLVILTNVEKVFINFRKENQKALDDVKLDEIKEYYENGEFLPGSMGPKILAAIRFLENGGKKVIISHVDKGYSAFKGKTGTHITK